MPNEETTTEGAEVETTSDNTETSNDAPEAVETTSTQETSTSSDDLNVPVDLESVPKEYRQYVEKHVKKYEKDFKGAYTKKTQDYSARTKVMESEIAQFKAQKEAIQRDIQEALADPAKYEAYRKLYGMNGTTSAQEDFAIPEFKTVGDLVAWNKQQIAKETQRAVAEARAAASMTISQNQEVSKWRDAVNAIKSKDPKFSKFENLISKMADDQVYKSHYQSTGDALGTLTKVYEDFKSMILPELEETKQKTLDEQKKKKSASTTTPGKVAATEVPKANQPTDVVLNRILARTAHLR